MGRFNSLHPNKVAKFVGIINNMLEFDGVQYIEIDRKKSNPKAVNLF